KEAGGGVGLAVAAALVAGLENDGAGG
ncbi:hypothetical protein AZSI13_10200, partial [Azospira sp. I13]